jgi:hypothetical protein
MGSNPKSPSPEAFMHSHDRTLLAKLGFADPDKSEPIHDLACRFLTEPEQALKLIGLVDPRPTERWNSRIGKQEPYDPSLVLKQRSVEQPISKGVGQYKTTIGFIDGLISYSWQHPEEDEYDKNKSGKVNPQHYLSIDRSRILIEVKWNRVECGNILRQIRLYQEYEGHSYCRGDRIDILRASQGSQSWIVATGYPLTSSDVALLSEHGVTSVRLGDGFKEWVKKNEAHLTEPAHVPEL